MILVRTRWKPGVFLNQTSQRGRLRRSMSPRRGRQLSRRTRNSTDRLREERRPPGSLCCLIARAKATPAVPTSGARRYAVKTDVRDGLGRIRGRCSPSRAGDDRATLDESDLKTGPAFSGELKRARWRHAIRVVAEVNGIIGGGREPAWPTACAEDPVNVEALELDAPGDYSRFEPKDTGRQLFPSSIGGHNARVCAYMRIDRAKRRPVGRRSSEIQHGRDVRLDAGDSRCADKDDSSSGSREAPTLKLRSMASAFHRGGSGKRSATP